MASSSCWVCTERSVPLGRNCRTRPFQFSLEPRCHGECGSQKYTGMPVATLNWWWAASSLPWSQVNERASCAGSCLMCCGDARGDVRRGFVVEFDQHAVAGGALDEGGDEGAGVGADDQVAFPVAGHGAVVGFGGPLGDVDHVDDLRSRRDVAALWLCVWRCPERKHDGEFFAQLCLWPAHRSLGRSLHATPTTVAHRGGLGVVAARSAPVTIASSATTPHVVPQPRPNLAPRHLRAPCAAKARSSARYAR